MIEQHPNNARLPDIPRFDALDKYTIRIGQMLLSRFVRCVIGRHTTRGMASWRLDILRDEEYWGKHLMIMIELSHVSIFRSPARSPSFLDESHLTVPFGTSIRSTLNLCHATEYCTKFLSDREWRQEPRTGHLTSHVYEMEVVPIPPALIIFSVWLQAEIPLVFSKSI